MSKGSIAGVFSSDAYPPLLLVEDGPLTLLSTKVALEDAGYRVLSARHGASAMALLDTPIAALITDIRLPGGFDGWHVAREARLRWPDLPILYITGEKEGDWPLYGVEGSRLLQKPYSAHKLVTVLDQMMPAGLADSAQFG